MKAEIQKKLCEIERKENCRILLAVESGSRAWGFASPDSDYDVRFIYVRPREYYLKLEKSRDVLEYPIHDLLDINGWDLNKTLRLLHKSNPTVFEWFSSPIIYQTSPFASRFKSLMQEYFSSKNSLWHYISMAENNNREYLHGDRVKAKKYFYVLRPVLACRWILEKGTPPPMLFTELMDSQLDGRLRVIVEDLLEMKIHAPEVQQIDRIDSLNRYLDTSIADIKQRIAVLPAEAPRDWAKLDALFLSELG
ncbi:MAG TPA: nucleotidyltransferase domain-containing protein [Firmicutes bacterium]|nr:nucleotidyltransferase domain-containing protein [Bacillota bacterium]